MRFSATVTMNAMQLELKVKCTALEAKCVLCAIITVNAAQFKLQAAFAVAFEDKCVLRAIIMTNTQSGWN